MTECLHDYASTGLTPEQVAELATAEREGRLVVRENACEECFNDLCCHNCEIPGLSPCPFCGSAAYFRTPGTANDLLRIECSNQFTSCCGFTTADTPNAKQYLRNKWNTRPEAEAVLEKMKERQDD